MKIVFGFIALLVLTSAASAQQQITPSQMAIQIDNAVNGLASSVENLQTQLRQSEADKARAQARVKELEDKYEPKKEVPKN